MSDYITIPLSKTGKYAGMYETIVSIEDADLADKNWQIWSGHGLSYAVNRNHVRLHRYIMERILDRKLDNHEEIDHINCNGLDNRRENLRIATSNQNAKNKKRYKTNKTGCKGVHWDESRRKYRAQIQVNKKKIMLGQYDTLEEAQKSYQDAAIKYHGEFARME